MMQEQYDARRAELADMVRQKNRSMVQMDVQRLEAGLAVMTEQEQAQQKAVEEQQKEAEKFGSSTVDIEMMRADIKNLDVRADGTCRGTGEAAGSRFTPRRESRSLWQSGIARIAVERLMRIALTVMAMLAGFCAPGRRRRVLGRPRQAH